MLVEALIDRRWLLDAVPGFRVRVRAAALVERLRRAIARGGDVGAIDVLQAGGRYVVRIGLPAGVDGVELPLNGRVLRVAAADRQPRRFFRLGEGRRGRFLRRVVLPPGLDAGELRAEVREGTLEIRIPA